MIALSDDEGVSCEKDLSGLSTWDTAVVRVASVQSVAETEGNEVVVSAEILRGGVSSGHVDVTVIITVGVTAVALEVWLRHSGDRSFQFKCILLISKAKVPNPSP